MYYAENQIKFSHTVIAGNREMMHWQYVPIKKVGSTLIQMPAPNLEWTRKIVTTAMADFMKGMDQLYFRDYYFMYLTVKSGFVNPAAGKLGNRPGWHIDGFGTEDENYIWMDRNPTEVLMGFEEEPLIYEDHNKSMDQMAAIAAAFPTYIQDVKLGQLHNIGRVIHRPAPQGDECFRNFVKVSFSKRPYNLEGNSINHNLDLNWPMKERTKERNCPQGSSV